MMVGIPVWNDQVSTTFDFTQKFLVVQTEGEREVSRKEVALGDQPATMKAQALRDMGVQVVLCGAVSHPLARAVAKAPDVLLCDEPTGALDYTTGVLVLDVLQHVNRELGTTLAIITHNAAIGAMGDRVLRMGSGRIIEVRRNERPSSPADIAW